MAGAATNAKGDQSPRNARVHMIDRREWQAARNYFFRRNVKFAAAAKATRTALGVAQQEVARSMDLSITAISNRESGKYAWLGDEKELQAYQRACMRIAGVK